MPVEEQGAGLKRYRVIPRVLIFIFNQGAVLLIKGAPTKRLWANHYNGIGGHVERGEDILSAARRELLEEAGLAVPQIHLCGTVMVDAEPDSGIGLFVFRGEAPGQAKVHSHEGETEWVLLTDLEKYPLVEDLHVLIPKITHMQPEDAPFAARYYYDEEQKLQIIFAPELDYGAANS
ncbi:MAG: NUDIX hydrolase [Bellilinea sp.]